MKDSKPQHCVQQHKLLKMKLNATNRDKHIKEASKQTSSNNLFKVSCKYTQSMLFNWKICFNVINIQTYDELMCSLSKSTEFVKWTTCTDFFFDVSKLQKQLWNVIQIHLDHSANFIPLIWFVCVTVSHNVSLSTA